MKILVDDGEVFDGDLGHWCDTFFSNPTRENVLAFCEEQGWKVEILDEDESSWPVTGGTQLMDLLESIEMIGTKLEEWRFGWAMGEVEDRDNSGWMIQCSFERPDANGNFDEQGVGYGRKWFVEHGATVESVVFTAWLALQQIITHELHESFTVMVNGERVRLLDPHKSLTDLAVGSRRV